MLGDRALPQVAAPKAAAGGLRFVGYTSRPGALGYMSRLAKRTATAIARELRA